jgi:GntR family transcriptional regulator/MocR family aminotransferase
MPRTRTSSQPELLLNVDTSGGPLHTRIERALREAVREGRLRVGAALPSTRVLARELGVSRGVVVEAYEQLVAEGYLAARAGSKTVVAAGAPAPCERGEEAVSEAPAFDFRPGVPDLTRFPREEWGRAMRRALREVRPADLSYGDPRGALALRESLREYLGRVRGVVTRPERVVVCNGFTQALALIARALRDRGARRIALEDPCHPDLRHIAADGGLSPLYIPVDESGLRVDLLDRVDVQAVLVTPAHQFPTGVVMTAERRHALIEWAARRSAFVIEDDYDAEYRYDRVPVGAIQGLAPERVVYAGSSSKILAPALRLGWVIVPEGLGEGVAERKRIADLSSPILEQLTYAVFLEAGELDRHLRRMRLHYRRRRDALTGALARRLPGWHPTGAVAGLHLVAELPEATDEEDVVRRAGARSVRVYAMKGYCGEARRAPALVLGYAGLDEGTIDRGIARLAAALMPH